MPNEDDDSNTATLSPRETVRRLNADLKSAAKKLTQKEARYMVDLYYQMQKFRIHADNQKRAADAGGDHAPKPEDAPEAVPEPNTLVTWIGEEFWAVETLVKNAMGHYADSNPVGAWSRTLYGIGPVLSAGLLAHIDINRAPTAGAIQRYAGLDPSSKWLGREGAKDLVVKAEAALDAEWEEHPEQKIESGNPYEAMIASCAVASGRKPENLLTQARDLKSGAVTKTSLQKALARQPWNARLKCLAYKIGESFVKVSGREDDVYGHLYLARKAIETANNEKGLYADQARAALEEKNYGKDTEAYKHYKTGKLPPARIHARARRWAVKLFLSHWHGVAFWVAFKKLPPLPYVIEHKKHTDVIAIPNAHLVEGLAEALRKANRKA